MCNIGKALGRIVQPITSTFERAFTPPGTGGAEAAQQQAQAEAQAALAAQQQATAQAAAAADTQSETARLANESRLRKLIGAGSFGASFGNQNSGAAPVAYRQLFGG